MRVNKMAGTTSQQGAEYPGYGNEHVEHQPGDGGGRPRYRQRPHEIVRAVHLLLGYQLGTHDDADQNQRYDDRPGRKEQCSLLGHIADQKAEPDHQSGPGQQLHHHRDRQQQPHAGDLPPQH